MLLGNPHLAQHNEIRMIYRPVKVKPEILRKQRLRKIWQKLGS